MVQFRAGSDFQAGRVEGRVEHIASGLTGCFHSTWELLALLDRVLTDQESRQGDLHRGSQRDAEGASRFQVKPTEL